MIHCEQSLLFLPVEHARKAKPREASETAFIHVLVNFHFNYFLAERIPIAVKRQPEIGLRSQANYFFNLCKYFQSKRKFLVTCVSTLISRAFRFSRVLYPTD